MKHSLRLILSILAIACTGLFTAQLAAQQEAQLQTATPVEPLATQKLVAEIQAALFPLKIKVTPGMFSRRVLPSRERNHLDVVLLSAPEADVVPLQVTIKRGDAAPVHYASGRYNREKKILELKYQPVKGEAVWLAPDKWYTKTRPVS